MEPLTLRFGTPKPIPFREHDAHCPLVDLDLEARIAGSAQITEAEPGALPDGMAPDVVRARLFEALQVCLALWPEGESVVRGAKSGRLAERFAEHLASRGIRAAVEISSFQLTEESQALYDAMLLQAMKTSVGPGWDHLDFEGQPGQIRERQKYLDGMMPMPPMPAPPTPSPRGVAPVSGNAATDKYCRQCGTKRPEGARFCPECGAPFG